MTRFELVLAVSILALAFPLTTRSVREDTLGDGTPSVPCDVRDFLAIANRYEEYQIRESVCEIGSFAGQDILSTFVFVHPIGDARDFQNLAFHYDIPYAEGERATPQAKWAGESLLDIRIPRQADLIFRKDRLGYVTLWYEYE